MIYKLIIPVTIISFTIFTKWWFVLPIDAPETYLYGFPFPFFGNGWHTSGSLQVFILELFLDFLFYFLFWLALFYLFDRFVSRIRINRFISVFMVVTSTVLFVGWILVLSMPDHMFHLKRDWGMNVKEAGYKFIWESSKRTD